jgi:hypothetical protein
MHGSQTVMRARRDLKRSPPRTARGCLKKGHAAIDTFLVLVCLELKHEIAHSLTESLLDDVFKFGLVPASLGPYAPHYRRAVLFPSPPHKRTLSKEPKVVRQSVKTVLFAYVYLPLPLDGVHADSP